MTQTPDSSDFVLSTAPHEILGHLAEASVLSGRLPLAKQA